MPSMVEVFIVSFNVQVWDTGLRCYKIGAVDKNFFCHCCNKVGIDMVGIGEYYLAPVLEITCISVKIFKSYIHNRPLCLKNVLSVVG